MAFGAFVIGDEILLGKRPDRHLGFLAAALARRGLRLAWCQILGDDPVRLAAAFRTSFASGDVVFSFGGIGATPDDHTRSAAAAALGVPLVLHPDAEREIRGRFGAEATAQRLRMGEFPLGAEIIPNPFNRIPGFSIRGHWFLPGFPQMAWPMVDWVLDTRYRQLFGAGRWAEASVRVYGLSESAIAPLMEEVDSRFPGLKTFSLPSMGEDGSRLHIELGVRGASAEIEPAMEAIRSGVAALGGTLVETEGSGAPEASRDRA